MKKMGSGGYEIPPHLLSSIIKAVPELSLPELSLIVHSLHMCHIKVGNDSNGMDFRHGLCKVICSVGGNERTAIAYEDCIMNLAKFLTKKNNAGTTKFYNLEMRHYSQEIADKYALLAPHLSPATVARILALVRDSDLDKSVNLRNSFLCRFWNTSRPTTPSLPKRASVPSWRTGTRSGRKTSRYC